MSKSDEQNSGSDTKRPSADEAHSDDPRQSIESGDQKIAGHTQGHVEGTKPPGAKADHKDEDWESGRQGAL